MKKSILFGTLFVSMMSVASISQAEVKWENIPWQLVGVSYQSTIKVCHWRKQSLNSDTGRYEAKIKPTYAFRIPGVSNNLIGCPAPLVPDDNIPTTIL